MICASRNARTIDSCATANGFARDPRNRDGALGISVKRIRRKEVPSGTNTLATPCGAPIIEGIRALLACLLVGCSSPTPPSDSGNPDAAQPDGAADGTVRDSGVDAFDSGIDTGTMMDAGSDAGCNAIDLTPVA